METTPSRVREPLLHRNLVGRGPLDGLLFKTFPRLVLGRRNADFCDRSSVFQLFFERCILIRFFQNAREFHNITAKINVLSGNLTTLLAEVEQKILGARFGKSILKKRPFKYSICLGLQGCPCRAGCFCFHGAAGAWYFCFHGAAAELAARPCCVAGGAADGSELLDHGAGAGLGMS